MKTVIILAVLGLLVSNTSCTRKKTNIVPITIEEPAIFDLTDSCDPYVQPGLGEPEIWYKGEYISYLVVNPNNPNEFVDYNPYYSNLYLLNRQTLQSTLIMHKLLYQPVKWGRSGHLLFFEDEYLYSIKPNGDSLSLQAKAYFFCDWNYQGNKFMYWTKDSTDDHDIFVIQDFYSKERDTISTIIPYGTWANEDNLYLQISKDLPKDFIILNLTANFTISYPSLSDGGAIAIFNIQWVAKDEFIYSASTRYIYKYNINTNTNIKLVKFCYNRYPISISYSYMSNEIFVLLGRKEYTENSDKVLISSPQILILNLNNNTKSVINLP